MNNVYKLIPTKQTIWYLHAATYFPTKATWIKAIHARDFIIWPLLTVNNIGKYFPEFVLTQNGYMKGLHQNDDSTHVEQDTSTTTEYQKS